MVVINVIRNLKLKIKIKLANKSSDSKVKYLRGQGANIGDGTRLVCQVSSFGSEPYLISVGKKCLFSAGIHLITHDGGVKVLSDLEYFKGERMDIIAPIVIGDNVYIGTGVYVMPGVTIGNNVVIGAGAIVTRDIPDNSVAVEIPCRVIKSIDEYYRGAVEKARLHPTAQMPSDEKKAYFQGLGLI